MQQCAVALLMVLFDLCNETEALRQFRESLFLGSLGKVLIHVGPFVIFAGGSGSQVGLCVADAGQFLEPKLRMLLFVFRRLQEQRCHLLIALFFCDGRKKGVLISRLRLARKCCAQICFGFCACIFVHDPVSFFKNSCCHIIPCLTKTILSHSCQFYKRFLLSFYGAVTIYDHRKAEIQKQPQTPKRI